MSQIYKPSSVESNHLSWPVVTNQAHAISRGSGGLPYRPFNLAPSGVYISA